MQIKNVQSDQAGSVLLLVLILIVALLGFTAFVIDAGRIYINKAKMSNAVDSAVMAGVQELPNSPGQAIAVAENYAQQNGVTA